jgi:hypothetical protein
MSTPDETIAFPVAHYRLLTIDADFVVVFEPLPPGSQGADVKLRRFKKGDVALLETN